MSASVLVISNYRKSSMSYMSSLHAYGYAVDDTRTFETARILLRTGNHPTSIVIDVKFHTDEIAAFIQFVRSDMQLNTTNITIIGYENDILRAYGADDCLARPVNFADIVQTLEFSH